MHRLIEQSLIPDTQTVVAFGQEIPDLQTDKQTDAAKHILSASFAVDKKYKCALLKKGH